MSTWERANRQLLEGGRGLNKTRGDTWIASAARGEPRCVWRTACSSGFLLSRKEAKEGTLICLHPFRRKFFKIDAADFRLEMQLLHCVICPFSVVSNRSKWDEVVLKLLKELHTVVLWAKGFFYMAVDALFYLPITWVEVVIWMSTWLLPTCWQSRVSLWSELHQNIVWQRWKTAAECLRGAQFRWISSGGGRQCCCWFDGIFQLHKEQEIASQSEP